MFKQTFRKLMFMLIGLAILGLFAFLLPAKPAYAANPGTINFQGKVTNPNGTNVADGTYTFVFRLYQNVNVNTYNPNASSCASDTNCWWEETDSLTVTSGVFQVSLGAGCAFTSACNSGHSGISFNSQNSLSLTMKFNGDSAGYMTPLITFSSVPYAFQADNAGNLGGLASSNFVQLAQGLQTDSSTTNASIAINKTGSTANILTLQKSSTSVFIVDNNGLINLQPAASLTSGQTNITQSLTNASSTGGTVNGYSQTITVNNTGSASSTNAINISLADNASSLTNTNVGLAITLNAGSNASQTQIGANIAINRAGIGLKVVSNSSTGTGIACTSGVGTLLTSVGVCGIDISASSSAGTAGVVGASNSVGANVNDATEQSTGGTGVAGNNSSATTGSGSFIGVKGSGNGTGVTGTYKAIGVEGISKASSANATTYGGYFALDNNSSTTLGSALYATNGFVSANILELQDGSTDVMVVADGGGTTLQNQTDSPFAFQIKNHAGSGILNVDNTNINTLNKIANSSFESTLSNWSAIGSANAPTRSSLGAYEGSWGLFMQNTGSGGGASYSTGSSFLSSATTYTLSAYVKTNSSLLVTTFELGYMNDGTTPSSCLTAQTLPQNGGFQHFMCTFTTGTVSGSPSIYFRQTDSASRSIFVDDVLLQTDSSADTNYRNAAINFTGAIVNGAVILQNAVNSANALQVENASGNTIFNVDTTDTNLISNPGFETNATNWSGVSSATIRRDSGQSYLGGYSLKVTASGTANNGAQFALNPVVTAQSVQYTLSWFAKLDGSSSAMTDMAAVYSPEGTTLNTCTPASGTVSTSGWTRYSCSVTDSTHAPTTSGFIRIVQTGTTTGHIYYIDAVQLEAAASASAYGAGAVSLNGVITSPVVFKSTAATTAFQVQNSSSLNLLGADSLNNLVQIGSFVSHSSNPVVLVLDDYNNASDPSSGQATNGAMYYNASTNKFRCYQNGSWTNCIGVVNAVTLVAVRTSSTGAIGNTETQVLGYSIPGGSTAAGDTYRITAYYTRAGTNTTAPTFRIRVGQNSLTGNVAATLTGTAAGTANNGVMEGIVTIQTTGVAGTVGGGMWNLHNADTSPHVASTATVAVNTGLNELIELTCISGQNANSYTFTYVSIEKISNQ